MRYEFLFKGNTHSVTVEKHKDGFKVMVGDRVHQVNASALSEGLLSLIIDGRSVLAHTAQDEKGSIVCIHGVSYTLGDPAADEARAGASSAHHPGDGVISTPMPGKIVTVHVKEGDAVEKGQPLLVVESMKMQNDILSDVDGVVKKVHFKSGDQASFGEPLVEIDVDEG